MCFLEISKKGINRTQRFIPPNSHSILSMDCSLIELKNLGKKVLPKSLHLHRNIAINKKCCLVSKCVKMVWILLPIFSLSNQYMRLWVCGVDTVPTVLQKMHIKIKQNITKTLCCVASYCLPIISSLSTSSTGVIVVSASAVFGIVSILSI